MGSLAFTEHSLGATGWVYLWSPFWISCSFSSDFGSSGKNCSQEYTQASHFSPHEGRCLLFSFPIDQCPMLKKIKKKITKTFCSVAKLCLTLCDPMDSSLPGFLVLHFLPRFAQTHVHWVSDTIQSSHPLFPPSPPALNLSQNWGLFQWVNSSHQVAKVLELQLQQQSFQFRVDFL